MAANSLNRYLVYTRPEDEASLWDAPAFRRLASIVPVQVVPIREEITEPHRTMSDCHIDSVRRADEADAAAVFLPPDCIWSDRSMVRLEEIARTGKSVVHMSGIRLDRDRFVPELANRYSEENLVLSMNSRELVSVALPHLHPITFTHFWNEYDGGLFPANLIWTVSGEGLLLRCFHLHPLMVKSQVRFAKFESTIDDDLPLRACPDASRDYVVTDSDELLAFEMSGLSRVVGTVCAKGSVEGVAAWAEVGANQRHRKLIRHRIRLHAGPISEPTWATTEAESDKVVDAVAKFNALSWRDIIFKYPAMLNGRLYAKSLGRGVQGGQLAAWVHILVWLRAALLRLNTTSYQMLFLRNGAAMITHPYWLVRQAIRSTLENCIARGDRHVILIGAEPNLALQLEQVRPGVAVQAFTSDFVPDMAFVQKADSDAIDLLVAIDVDRSKANILVPQQVGKRRILLRLAGDTRPVEGTFDQIKYFGSLGTRFCAILWNWTRRLRIRLRPAAELVKLPLKAAMLLLMPLIYCVIALICVPLNVIGVILDFSTGGQLSLYEDEKARLHGPSA